MSHLSPLGLGVSFAESSCPANDLANSLVVEHVPPEIRHIVCENYWHSVFSAEFFQIAWKPKPELDYSNPSSFFSYETPTWRQMQRQRRQHWIKFRYSASGANSSVGSSNVVTSSSKKFDSHPKIRSTTWM
ncbi:hypothetical protein EDD85DRAFT_952271 [Armillaria nabsnona]|nr:hypothetical protein EDD85DRAFT_952271 [Armillaria nabsnona]